MDNKLTQNKILFREWSSLINHPDIRNNKIIEDSRFVETTGPTCLGGESKFILLDKDNINGICADIYRDPTHLLVC